MKVSILLFFQGYFAKSEGLIWQPCMDLVDVVRGLMHEILTFCALDLFITADENMDQGIFTFWAGSLHFFGAI